MSPPKTGFEVEAQFKALSVLRVKLLILYVLMCKHEKCIFMHVRVLIICDFCSIAGMIATLPRNHAPNPSPMMMRGGPPVSHRPPRGPGRGPVRSASVNIHTHGTRPTLLRTLLLL